MKLIDYLIGTIIAVTIVYAILWGILGSI